MDAHNGWPMNVTSRGSLWAATPKNDVPRSARTMSPGRRYRATRSHSDRWDSGTPSGVSGTASAASAGLLAAASLGVASSSTRNVSTCRAVRSGTCE